MSQEEAVIALVYDARQATSGAREFEQAGQKIMAANRQVEQSTERIQTALSGQQRALNAMERRYDPVSAATRKLEGDQRRLNDIIAAGGPGLERAQRLLAQVEQRQRSLAAATQQASQTVSSGIRATQMAANAQDAAAASARRLNGAIGQVGFQVQDAANQLATGTNAFTVLGMQGGQLLGALGPVGAAMGALVNVGGVLAGTMFNLASASDKVTQAQEKFDDALGTIATNMQRAIEHGERLTIGHASEATAVQNLTAHYKSLSVTMRDVERIRITSQRNKAVEAMAEQRTAVRGLMGDLADLDVAVSRAVQLQEVTNASRAKAGASALPGVSQSLRDVAEAMSQFKASGPEDVEAIGRLAVALDAGAKAGGPFAEKMKSLAAALADPASDYVAKSEGLKIFDANLRLLAGTATNADRTLLDFAVGGGQAAKDAAKEAAKQADEFADMLERLAQKGRELERQKLEKAVGLINSTIQDGLTPQQQYAQHVRDVNDALQLAAANGFTLSAEKAEALNKALKEADPAFKEAQRAAEKYQQEISSVAKDIASDWTETMYDAIILKDKNASILDAFRALGKRIALALLETNIVLPITTSIVGSVPGLFGIQGPANQNAANQNGMGGGNALSGASGALSLIGGSGGDGLFGGGMGLMQGVTNWASEGVFNLTGSAGLAQGVGMGLQAAPWGIVGGLGASLLGLGNKNPLISGAGGLVGSVAGGALGGSALGSVLGAAGGPVGAVVGSFLGTALTGLFGNQKPSNKEGNVSIDFATGSTAVGGQDGKKYSAENRQAAQGIGGQIQQLAATLEALLPGQQIAGRGLVAVGSRDGLRAEYGGQKAEFGKEDTAGLVSWFTKQFAADMKDGFERGDLSEQVAANLKAVLDRGVVGGVEQFAADVQFAATNFATAFDAFGRAQPEQISGQITEVATAFVAMNDNAAKLGTTVKGAAESLKGATDRMIDSAIRSANGTGFIDQAMTIRATFEKVGQQLLSTGQDGSKAVQLYGAQMSALVNSFGEDENAIKNLGILADAMHGVDDVAEAFARLRIEQVRGTLTAKEQADAAAKLADEQAKAAEKMLAQADNLTAWLNGQALGDTSSLSPWAKMEEAQRQFDAALSTSRQTGDISGATKAADALLSASKPTLVMGTEAYSQREAWITSTLRNLGRELGLPQFATGGDHLGGLRIVGERGPELEWTGPSRIFSADQTRQILAGASAPQAAPNVTVNVDMVPVVRALSQVVNVLSAKLDKVSAELSSLKGEQRKDTNLGLAGIRRAS